MRSEYENRIAAEFTRPWSERRGIEENDRYAEVVLVRVPLNELSDLLAAKAIETHRNVMGSEIELSDYFAFTYQLAGHVWSIIVTGSRATPDSIPSEAELSKQLGEPVISLSMGKTDSYISYDLFENGEIVEYFTGWEGESAGESKEETEYILSPYSDHPDFKQTAIFYSRCRQVTPKEIGDIWSFAVIFFEDFDAYDPDIGCEYLLGEYDLESGSRYRVQNPGFTLTIPSGGEVTSVPDLVGVDYFKFG
jgi:hypothetical protein